MKIILFISALLILFSGCSSVYADKVGANRETSEKRGVSENSEIFFLLLAMDLETKELFSDSAEVFNSLYKDGAGDRYSVEYLRSLNNSGQFVKVIEEVYLLNLNEDDHIREVAKALFALRDYENSISTLKSINLLKEIDYRFLAEACFKSGKFNEAVEYLQDAYRLEPSKDLMLSLAKVLYIYFGKSEEAIANLREHERIHGYDEDISSYLAKIYVESSKFNEATKIYRELYNKTSKDDYAISLVDIFSKTSNTDGLIEFLEESRFNNELLLRLYMAKKRFEKGLKLSEKMFNDTKEPYILAQNAVFEYELNIEKGLNNREFLNSVISKLEKVVPELKDATFYNYLGYLMINHDIRVKDGLKYAKNALEIEPDSVYILDSVAWGEFKLGNCKDAFSYMKKVVDEIGTDDKEINRHWQKINSCEK